MCLLSRFLGIGAKYGFILEGLYQYLSIKIILSSKTGVNALGLSLDRDFVRNSNWGCVQ